MVNKMSGGTNQPADDNQRSPQPSATSVASPDEEEKKKKNEWHYVGTLDYIEFGRPGVALRWFLIFPYPGQRDPGYAKGCVEEVKGAEENNYSSIDFKKLAGNRNILHRMFGMPLTVRIKGKDSWGQEYCDVLKINSKGKIVKADFDPMSTCVDKAEMKLEVNKNTRFGKKFKDAEIIKDFIDGEKDRRYLGIKSPYATSEVQNNFEKKLAKFNEDNKAKLNYKVQAPAPPVHMQQPVQQTLYIQHNTPPDLARFSPLHPIFMAQAELGEKFRLGQLKNPQDFSNLRAINMQIRDIMKNGYDLRQPNGQLIHNTRHEAGLEKQKFDKFIKSAQVSQGGVTASHQYGARGSGVHLQNGRF